MSTCNTCVWWTKSDDDWDDIENPVDPDTYEPMATTFEVRQCKHPDLMFCERPLSSPGFAIADGSGYMADLYTTEHFGCVMHQEEEEK